jgi:hypothetical protein
MDTAMSMTHLPSQQHIRHQQQTLTKMLTQQKNLLLLSLLLRQNQHRKPKTF